jgi:hypothetical protein
MQNVSKDGAVNREEGENDRVNNTKIHHICVRIRHNKMHWKLLNNSGWGEMLRKIIEEVRLIKV